MSGSLGRNRIMKLFETLSARLAARGTRGQLYIVGGSAMIGVIRGVADRPTRGLHLVMRGSRDMPLSDRIKPISYLKAHAAEIIRTLADQPEPLIVTQNGEAKAVVQDIDSYEQMQESMALLKMLALGNRQIDAGRVQPAAEVIARLRERHQAD